MDSKRVLLRTLTVVTLTCAGPVITTTESRSWPGAASTARTWSAQFRPSAPAARKASRPRAESGGRFTAARRPHKGVNRRIARRLLERRSWSSRQFHCLDSLWTRESNWNHRAHNRSSGAYGIPQALPARKMSRVGRDWRRNPATQIRWGLRYIKGRYGRPCGAWGHFRSHRWY